MFNRERTKEVFGYDLDLNIRRRSNKEFEDTNKVKRKNLKVVDNCPECGKERQITLHASRKNKPCYKCHHAKPHVIEAKKNQNKDVSDETKNKMKESHWSKKGVPSPFKGKRHTKESKKALSKATKKWYKNASKEEIEERAKRSSCSFRGIKREEFNGWASDENKRLRSCKEYKEFEKQVLKRDKNTCSVPGCRVKRKRNLVVHHKDGFHWCEERRFDPTNGVVLCKEHHFQFHSEYSSFNNTEEQFATWIQQIKKMFEAPVKLFVIAGPSGSGKTWICEQLSDHFSYVSFDRTPKEQHILKIMEIAKKFPNKPILYDPFRKAISIFNRYKDIWPCEFVVITETIETIIYRIINRNGSPDVDSIVESVERHKALAPKAHFSGTSEEVLQYLKSKQEQL